MNDDNDDNDGIFMLDSDYPTFISVHVEWIQDLIDDL